MNEKISEPGPSAQNSASIREAIWTELEATIEQLFRRQAKHIEEHVAQIQQSFN